MKIPILFRTGIFAFLAAGLVGGFSVRANAAGAGEGTASKRPVPDIEQKVITNDDLEARYGKPTPATEIKNSETISAAARTTAAAQPARSAARREPLPPEKNPVWYARQVVSLNDEIASIDDEAQRLIGFRSPGNTPGPGTGLVLNAPCEGVGTDNRIAQLFARRQEIESQVAALQDTAHRNDMPPGLFDQAAEIAQASERRPALTPAQERAALAEQLDQLSSELAETQSVVEGMQEDTAARRMTLLPPTGNGANMTTDLLARLRAQSSALQSQIGSVEDDALRAGIPARDLP